MHDAWALPGAPSYEDWEMTDNVASFLRSGHQGGPAKDVTTVVTAIRILAVVL